MKKYRAIDKSPKVRVNEKIVAPEVRVIDGEGEQLGVMPVEQALDMAHERGLDLVEVSGKSDPPVCRLMDYGRYKFQAEKRAAEARKHQSVIHVKEIKLRPSTGDHDYETKMRHARRFLEGGDRLKVTIRFRGREIVHPDLGMELLRRVAEDLEDVSTIDAQPKMEGRQLFLMLAPRTKA